MEEFFKLKEIMSLEQKAELHLKKIAEEQKRLEQVDRLRESRQRELSRYSDQLKQINQTVQTLEQQIDKTVLRLKFLESQEKQIANNQSLKAWEDEYGQLKQKNLASENQVLELLEQAEECDKAIEEAQVFLRGLTEGTAEINKEVQAIQEQERAQLEIIEKRKATTLAILAPTFQRCYLKARSKHPHALAFTWDQEGACAICYFSMNQLERQKLETGELIDNCKGCGRLFLPQKVVKNQS